MTDDAMSNVIDFDTTFNNYAKINSGSDNMRNAVMFSVNHGKKHDAVHFTKTITLTHYECSQGKYFVVNDKDADFEEVVFVKKTKCCHENNDYFIDVSLRKCGDVVTHLKCSHDCVFLIDNDDFCTIHDDFIIPLCCYSCKSPKLRIIFDRKPEDVTIKCDCYLLSSSLRKSLTNATVISTGVVYDNQNLHFYEK